MTNKDLTIRLEEINKEYIEARRLIEEKRRRDISIALSSWAKDNANYQVGDIIESFGVIMVVEKISGYTYSSGTKPYCFYKGHALTKDFQPRKDGWVTTIYDDGREIKLLRKKED